MANVLVAGAAGFLGSHLIDRLIKEGNYVIGIDNLITGSFKNLEHLKNNKNFKYIKHDITNPIKIKNNIDQIYNLASPASPIDYAQKPIETLRVGSIGTNNLLDLAKKKDARFLQASTSEVYGDPDVSPQKETYWGRVNPIGPRSCYDEAKRYAEALTVAYRDKENVDVRIIRIFNTYGPRMRVNDGRVIPAFCSQAIQGMPLTVFGDGKQTRSFCYVDDLIDGMYKLMQSDHNQPVNIGNPKEFTMMELAKEVQKIIGSDCKLEHKPLPGDDPKQRCPDISIAKRVLNWEPKVKLQDGLIPTIEYFRKELKK